MKRAKAKFWERRKTERDFSPHIDGGGAEDGWRVNPQPVPIQASTILDAAGVPGCGGT